jgi:5-dehydro-4-deoxyglucarate dehydratase
MTGLQGVLFFPVTPFRPDGAFDTNVFGEHVRRGVAAGPGAVFAACGTGEFHALSPSEHVAVVSSAVSAATGGVPVYAGAGGPVPVACAQARAAHDAGADGLLLMPPYLVECPPDGLVSYVSAVAAATDLPVIVYHRANARFDPRTAVQIAGLPTVVGIKDGVGDLDLLTRIVTAVRQSDSAGDFQFFNGLPTAELTVPAYRAIGVTLYSSAVFAFAPEISLAFYDAVSKGDQPAVDRLMAGFFVPLVTLRNAVPGYAVSLIKTAVRAEGLDVGGVRPPLVDPTPEHAEQLAEIVATGRVIVRELAGVRAQ